MDKDNLYLIYINLLGVDWKGEFNYEFIFSDTIDGIDGEDWDLYPASGQPKPPRADLIHVVGVLTSNLKLELVQDSDTFAVWDAVDGIISLGWEDISEYEDYPEHRLDFKFGQTIKSIEDSLYEMDFILNYKFKKNEFKKEDN